jgi:hypothetical protein
VIDDWLLSILWATCMAAGTMPLGFMLGAPCSTCCGCGGTKPVTDPKDEGTWVPSGTWDGVGGVTWTFNANPGDESGETWFFFGSAATSKLGGSATTTEQQDWGNICNWYSNKTTAPSSSASLTTVLDKRVNRLPPTSAVIHVYSPISTAAVGPQTVKNAYLWGTFIPPVQLVSGSELTTTASAHNTNFGSVLSGTPQNAGTINGGAFFNVRAANQPTGIVNGGARFYITQTDGGNSGAVNGGAVLTDPSANNRTLNGGAGVINGGAEFNGSACNRANVNGGAVFNNTARHEGGTVNDGAVLNDASRIFAANFIAASTVVNGGATFNGSSDLEIGIVNDGATFNDNSSHGAIVNGGAEFNGNAIMRSASEVNGGAVFNDNSRLEGSTTVVNGGAEFNDAACSTRTVGDFFATPCTRKFVAHPTDLPTCNGTAPDGCANLLDTCGCG